MKGKDLINITRRQFGKIANLISNKKHEVQVKTKFKAHLLEVEDVNFHHDSAVFLPDYGPQASQDGTDPQNCLTGLAVLQACYAHAKQCPEQSALVVGHTDRSGSKAYNQTLSDLRAQNVLHAIRGDRAHWADVCDEKHQVEDYQKILQWVTNHLGWNCDPGPKDNKLGPKTRSGLRAFQEQYNTRFSTSIPVTGSISRETWAAFFDVYMLDLKRLMGVDESGLAQARGRVHYLTCEAIGCGENYPITPERREHYRNPVDRRVEILFFDPGEEPALDCSKPKGACTELYKKKMYAFTPIDEAEAVETTYKLKLTFLGTDHVAHDAHYQCTFDLQDDSGSGVAAGDEVTADAYRVLTHDDHALRDDDGGLLGGAGDHISKPENYDDNDWIRDIRPAVALRVEVQQLRNGQRTRLPPDRFYVRWEVEDVEEEYARWDDAMAPDRPKTWLEKFFKHFQRDRGNEASKEDDNCPHDFGGARDVDKKIDPTRVLYKTPFRTVRPQPLASAGGRQARSLLTPETDDGGQPIGVSDVVFFPPPIGGDNYRFKLTITDALGNPLPLDGEEDHLITGVFTIWRKTTIDLLVTFDNVDVGYIKWDDIKAAYRAAFIEVEGPKETKKYDEATWKRVVRDYFINTVGADPAEVNDDARYDYANFFLPDLTGADSDWCWTHGEALAKVFLQEGYDDTGRTSPRDDDQQDDTPGLFVFLCKDLHSTSTALGMYLGEREFFMVTRGDGTVTFTHEMGHALYLRHALIDFDAANNVTVDIFNDNWLDHDQGDAVVCAMAYENDFYGGDGSTKRASGAVEWHFCAVCALKLRFYDTVEMTDTEAFRDLIYSDFEPITIADDAFNAFPGDKTSMQHDDTLDVKALGKAEPTVNNQGGPFKKDLTTMDDGQWVSSDTTLADFTTFDRLIDGDRITFQGRLEGQNAGSGTVTIHFEIDGHTSEEIEVDITS
jgi:hypothetical protein